MRRLTTLTFASFLFGTAAAEAADVMVDAPTAPPPEVVATANDWSGL